MATLNLMASIERHRRRRRSPLLRLGPTAILSTLLTIPLQLSSAQAVTSASSPISISKQPSTFTTSFTRSSLNNSFNGIETSTSTPSRPTSNDDAPDTSSSTSTADPDGADDGKTGLINYYFVFLAFFVILVFIGVYFAHRRRCARKERVRNSGQNALARDLDGWTSTRRWMNGHWRTESRSSRDEGLNELGQPPPPYVAKAGTHSREASAEEATTRNRLQIPLRTLSRDEGDRNLTKPPEYSMVVGESTANSPQGEGDRPITPLPAPDDLTIRNHPPRPS